MDASEHGFFEPDQPVKAAPAPEFEAPQQQFVYQQQQQMVPMAASYPVPTPPLHRCRNPEL